MHTPERPDPAPAAGGAGSPPDQLRIALTIAGAVALGAYEGGALAALLVAAQSQFEEGAAPRARIDAIGGASAGSITALLTARVLQGGLDPVATMYRTWAQRAALANLTRGGGPAPLSVDGVRTMAEDALALPDEMGAPNPAARPVAPPQNATVRVRMALASLLGLNYRIRQLDPAHPGRDTGVTATTYLDWEEYTFGAADRPDGLRAAYLAPADGSAAPLDVALASSANPLGFPAYALSRVAERGRYAESGIEDVPAKLWYTDAGTIDNEPLGHTLDVANAVDGDPADPMPDGGVRLHLLIHPHPHRDTSADASDWAVKEGKGEDPKAKDGPPTPPGWLKTLLRADTLQRTQSIYADLFQLEKTNTRLGWKKDLERVFGDLIEQLNPTQREGLEKALEDLLRGIEGQKEKLPGHKPGRLPPGQTSAGAPDVESLFAALLAHISGTAGKQQVRVGVVSPLFVLDEQRREGAAGAAGGDGAAARSVEDLLAGEFLAAFGGFLDRDLRRSDFMLGYWSMLLWMRDVEGRGPMPQGDSAAGGAHLPGDPVFDFIHRTRAVVQARWDELPNDLDALDRPDGASPARRPAAPGAAPTMVDPYRPWVRFGKWEFGNLPLCEQGAAYRLLPYIAGLAWREGEPLAWDAIRRGAAALAKAALPAIQRGMAGAVALARDRLSGPRSESRAASMGERRLPVP